MSTSTSLHSYKVKNILEVDTGLQVVENSDNTQKEEIPAEVQNMLDMGIEVIEDEESRDDEIMQEEVVENSDITQKEEITQTPVEEKKETIKELEQKIDFKTYEEELEKFNDFLKTKFNEDKEFFNNMQKMHKEKLVKEQDIFYKNIVAINSKFKRVIVFSFLGKFILVSLFAITVLLSLLYYVSNEYLTVKSNFSTFTKMGIREDKNNIILNIPKSAVIKNRKIYLKRR